MPRLDPRQAGIPKRGAHTILKSIISAMVLPSVVAATTASAEDTRFVDPNRLDAVQALNLHRQAPNWAASERDKHDSEQVTGNHSRKTLADILNGGPSERFERKMAASNHLHQLRNQRVARERAEREKATGEERARIDRAESRRKASEVIAGHIPKTEVEELRTALTQALDLVNRHREADNQIELEVNR